MKRFLPILLLSGFSSPVLADITHSISSSVQLNVNAAATQVERVGNSYSVSGTNIDVTTLGGMSADTDGAASFADGTYTVADDATTWAFTENFTVNCYWTSNKYIDNQMINDFLDNLAAQQYLKMHNHKEETCDGCGCVCPCECPDCDVCSCGA